MARPQPIRDARLLSKVTSLYYQNDETQQQIADRLRLSRATVSRLLQAARDRGIVQITVAALAGLHLDAETQLEARFGLVEARVIAVDPGQSAAMLRARLGRAAAGSLARTVQRGDTIGLPCRSTLGAMAAAMTPCDAEDVRVVQTVGEIGSPNQGADAASLVRRLAARLGATPILLAASAAIPGADAPGDAQPRRAREHLHALDTVYVGTGSHATPPERAAPIFPPRVGADVLAAAPTPRVSARSAYRPPA